MNFWMNIFVIEIAVFCLILIYIFITEVIPFLIYKIKGFFIKRGSGDYLTLAEWNQTTKELREIDRRFTENKRKKC